MHPCTTKEKLNLEDIIYGQKRKKQTRLIKDREKKSWKKRWKKGDKNFRSQIKIVWWCEEKKKILV